MYWKFVCFKSYGLVKDTVCVGLLNNMFLRPLLKKGVSDFQEFGS